jgi:hypothetical protein
VSGEFLLGLFSPLPSNAVRAFRGWSQTAGPPMLVVMPGSRKSSNRSPKAPSGKSAPTGKKAARVRIRPDVLERVKAAYGHRCAVCREPYVEVHHIDGDRTNNAESNLIPLCSNCHHGRVHGKAGHRLTAKGLRLYKELGVRFAATGPYNLLLRRLAYVTSGKFEQMDRRELGDSFERLISFVNGLEHGAHFVHCLEQLMKPPRTKSRIFLSFLGDDDHPRDAALQQQAAEYDARDADETEAYRETLRSVRPGLAELVDEILMAQDK